MKSFKNEAKKNNDGYGLQTQKISSHFQPGLVTVSDHLTSFYKNLLYNTKTAAREKGYKYVWTKDCKILVRKDEYSPVSRIYDFCDLDKL